MTDDTCPGASHNMWPRSEGIRCLDERKGIPDTTKTGTRRTGGKPCRANKVCLSWRLWYFFYQRGNYSGRVGMAPVGPPGSRYLVTLAQELSTHPPSPSSSSSSSFTSTTTTTTCSSSSPSRVFKATTTSNITHAQVKRSLSLLLLLLSRFSFPLGRDGETNDEASAVSASAACDPHRRTARRTESA